MKTAEEIYENNLTGNPLDEDAGLMDILEFEKAITERDKEWTQKIQTALSKTSNWNCKEVLTKLLEDK